MPPRIVTALTRILAVSAACLALQATSGAAQSLFSEVARVGDRIVTGYELEQRMRLMQLQGAAGDLRADALDLLINERLQLQAAEQAGVSVSDEELQAAVTEIAARTERTAEAFLGDLASEGIDPESFLANTRAGLAWRAVVQSRFGPLATVSDAEVERALGLGASSGTLEFRFAEIFLPTNTQNNADITAQLAPQIAALTDFDQFSDAARRFSVVATRENGGLIDRWVPISDLPANLRPVLIGMQPGEVTAPIEFPGAVGLFQLRAKREASLTGQGQNVDFITYRVLDDGNRPASERAAQLLERIDTCLDLYGLAQGSMDRLQRQTIAASALPAPLAAEIARLDAGESSVTLSDDGGRSVTLLSVCGRNARGETTDEDKEETRRALANRKLMAHADAYLEELRGETVITRR